jgi:hypothetical protein
MVDPTDLNSATKRLVEALDGLEVAVEQRVLNGAGLPQQDSALLVTHKIESALNALKDVLAGQIR